MRAYLLALYRTVRPATEPTARDALAAIRARVLAKHVPVIADDIDAGYDMAVDEVLDVIDDYQRQHLPRQKTGT